LLWPHVLEAGCDITGYQTWSNITLRNVIINNPSNSAGVLMGNFTNPMKNVVFDHVVVNNPGSWPFGDDFYHCQNIEGYALGGTYPVPPCFKQVESLEFIQ